MPPKKRVSAPPNRVYESTRPKHQTKLPEQKKRVRRSYGKKGGPRLDKPAEDDTLTQMGWVTLTPNFPEEEDESEYEEESKKRGKKRRKTLGDKPDTPQYHTQTISQMDWSFNSAPEESLDNPDEEKDAIFDGPYSSQSAKGSKKSPQLPELPKPAEPARRVSPRRTQAPKGDMPPPQTPRRIFRQEIPSSQSPATPISIQSGGSPRRSQRRSPLKEMSINTPIPFNTNRRTQKSPEKLPTLEVLDTFHTGSEISQQNRITSSSTRRSSVAKSVRFAIPGEEDANHVVSPTLTRVPHSSQPPNEWRTRTEILDSDAESDDEEDLKPEKPNRTDTREDEEEVARNLDADQQDPVQDSSPEDEDLGPETCYGEIGHETQMEAVKLVDLASSNADNVNEHEPESQKETFQERTQLMESQRLTSQHVKAMAPRTMESDIFISIHHSRVEGFVNRQRDHITRNWPIPPPVSRMWLYELAPVSTLKYMAVIGSPKRPGEIADESGDGNAEFNANKSRKVFAFEVSELYELADPLHLKQLVANEWLERPPTKFNRVPPVVLDQLMANLLPPLFGPNSANNTPPSSKTDTQEVEEQLSSTIRQFTQTQPTSSSQVHSNDLEEAQESTELEHIPSSPIPKIEYDSQVLLISSQINISEDPDLEETIPSSQQETTPKNYRLPGPSQATTVDLSQSQTPRENLGEIVFESPRRPVTSNTPLRLPTPRSSTSEYQGPEPLVPYSMASSQLLTKSQMLPDSLLGESLPGPPPFVGDSDDDEDAYSVELCSEDYGNDCLKDTKLFTWT